MCSRGVFQLRKLSIYFCDWGGSSAITRSFLTSPALESFKAKNPQIQLEFIKRRNHHPYIISEWINGYTKEFTLKDVENVKQIVEHMNNCRNSFGRAPLPVNSKKVIGVKESIQGKWFPNMWGQYPQAEMEKLHVFEPPVIPMKTKVVDISKSQNDKKELKDIRNDSLKARYANSYRGQ